MFEKHRETRQANRRHNQLMRIANEIVWEKDNGSPTRWNTDELVALFTGRVFARLHGTVDATEATNYLHAALARRGISVAFNV